MNWNGIRAVAFDAFGTLVEIGDKRRPYKKLLDAANPRPSRSPLLEPIGLEEMALLCGLSFSSKELEELANDLSYELASTYPYPEAAGVLKRVKDLKLVTVVASNLALPYAAPIHSLLADLLDVCCFSFDMGVAKPDPTFYAMLCERLQLHPSQVLMVGDTWRCDYAGASAAGLRALHLDRRGNAEEHQRRFSVRDLNGIFDTVSLV